jgi:hypothetical protein
MIDNKELAEYIYKRTIKRPTNIWVPLPKRKDWKEVPTQDELEFWIQQFKTKDCCGHSEWSERFQRNMWVSDCEEE